MISRRDLLRNSALGAGAVALGPAFWTDALAAPPAKPGRGPYGPLGAPDGNGLRLPSGFRSRVVASALAPVAGTLYPWHIFPDGMATFPVAGGGFVLVSNCEAPSPVGGGASAIRFGADGRVASAYRILGGTEINCSGGATPWGTWLSCEEYDRGRVWECDPGGGRDALARPAMGVFSHEAAAADPADRRIYLTEDKADGLLYRFTPDTWGDLSSGLLEAASGAETGRLRWLRVPDPLARTVPTRLQLPGASRFQRGEGIWFDSGVVYVATTRDERIHAFDTITGRIETLYDAKQSGGALRDVDNLTASRSGDLFVAEDADNLQICLISPEREVAPFVEVAGRGHSGSELTGVVFDPAGERLFFASQRAFGLGAIYEVSGPFRRDRPAARFPPVIEVEVPGRISLAALSGRGLPVIVKTPVGGRIGVALRTPRTKRRKPSPHSRRARRRLLARRRRTVASRGSYSLRVRPTAAGRRTLRSRRGGRIEVAVAVRDSAGNRTRVVRDVAVAPPRRRRAKKRA